jgi:transcriptional regulator with XRE-family HTH domain
MADIKQKIASAVRAARKERGLSQQDVADAAGVTLETVSKCERGASVPSVEVFLALVRDLQLNVSDLMDEPDGRAAISTRRARIEAELLAVARAVPDAQLELLADFAKLLGK